jgi:hypothetical protein
MKKFTNKPRQSRKLVVRHETIALLTLPQLDKVAGADMSSSCYPTTDPAVI